MGAYMGKLAPVILALVCFIMGKVEPLSLCSEQASGSKNSSGAGIVQKRIFSGPRQKIPPETPGDSGFWSFAISVPDIISRSGQPSIIDFRWLKAHGWRSVVDLRISDDAKIPGFNELHFNYLALPIVDGWVPTEQQAEKFLAFVTDPSHQPVHVHCHAGVGRAGVMIALYRYMVRGWSMDESINESRLFSGGVNKVQQDWLKKWAQSHKPGSLSLPNDSIKSK